MSDSQQDNTAIQDTTVAPLSQTLLPPLTTDNSAVGVAGVSDVVDPNATVQGYAVSSDITLNVDTPAASASIIGDGDGITDGVQLVATPAANLGIGTGIVSATTTVDTDVSDVNTAASADAPVVEADATTTHAEDAVVPVVAVDSTAQDAAPAATDNTPVDTTPAADVAGGDAANSAVGSDTTADQSTVENAQDAAPDNSGTAGSASASADSTAPAADAAPVPVAEWQWTDGDKDLIGYLANVEARNQPADAILINNLKAELNYDRKLRFRILDDIQTAGEVMDDVKLQGRVVTTKGGNNLSIPAGYGQDVTTLFTEQTAKLVDLVEGDDDRAKVEAVTNVMLHRAVLLDAALLNLRRIYAIHHGSMHPRVAALLQNVIADAIQMGDGTFPHVDAQMNDMLDTDWNYTQVPLIAGEHNTGHRNILVFYAGAIHPVTVFSYSLVEQIQPDPTAAPALAMILDHDLQMVVNQQVQLIGVRDIGCWRDPTEDDLAQYNWDVSEGCAISYHKQYQTTLALARQQQSGLILPPSAQEGSKLQLVQP